VVRKGPKGPGTRGLGCFSLEGLGIKEPVDIELALTGGQKKRQKAKQRTVKGHFSPVQNKAGTHCRGLI